MVRNHSKKLNLLLNLYTQSNHKKMSLQMLMQVRRKRDSKFNFYMVTLQQLKHSNQIEDKVDNFNLLKNN